jgi:hypothetical protein
MYFHSRNLAPFRRCDNILIPLTNHCKPTHKLNNTIISLPLFFYGASMIALIPY